MTVNINYKTGGAMVVDYVGEAAIGLQGNIANPEGVDLLVIESYIYIEDPSVAAATLNVGLAATGVDDSALHGALPLNGGSGLWFMGLHPAVTQDGALTAGVWGANEFLTLTTAAASAVGCVAKLFIKYLRVG
jgi:hypothetical protein